MTAAQLGDETAFREPVETYRRELHAHYYRMTDSLDDADDRIGQLCARLRLHRSPEP